MGNLFSKKTSKVAPERPINSAPARLEGLDGVQGPGSSRPSSAPEGSGDVVVNADAETVQAQKEALTPKTRVKRKVDVIGKQTDGQALAAALPVVNGQIPDECKHWAQVLPERVVRALHGSDWKDRETGITGASRALVAAAASPKAEDAFAVACEILAVTLKEKVAPLYHASLDMLQAVLGAFGGSSDPDAPKAVLPADTMRTGAATLVPQLLHRCGNNNSRIHEASLQALLGMASCPTLGITFLSPHVLTPLPVRGSKAAQITARLGLVSELLELQGNSKGAKSGGQILDEGQVMGMCKQGLEMADEKARTAAVKALVGVHTNRRFGGQPGLDADTCVGIIKPALAQLLARRFAEADGGELNTDLSVNGMGALRGPGKQLPPISNGNGAPRPSPLGGASSLVGAPPLAARASPVRQRLAATPPTPGSRVGTPGSRIATPSSPNRVGTPGSRVQTPNSPIRTGPAMMSGLGMPRAAPSALQPASPAENTPHVLDDQEEQLLNYIAGRNSDLVVV